MIIMVEKLDLSNSFEKQHAEFRMIFKRVFVLILLAMVAARNRF